MGALQAAITNLQKKHGALVEAVRGRAGTLAETTNSDLLEGVRGRRKAFDSADRFRNRIENDGQSLILDFANDVYLLNGRAKRFEDLIDFTRSTGGGRFGPDGKYEWLGPDVPRIDYDPETGECLGLLIEETRANIELYSNGILAWAEISNGAATSSTTVRVLNTAIAPDGQMTAFKMVTAIRNGQQRAYKYFGGLTGIQTFSYYVKAAEVGVAVIKTSALRGAALNLATGQFIYNDDGAIAKYCGNGWYRLSLTFDASVNAVPWIAMGDPVTGSSTFEGDGVKGMYVWGVQVEAGAFATSLIPTEGSAVTRDVDNPTRLLGSEYTPEGLTLFAECISDAPDTGGSASYNINAPMVVVGDAYNRMYGICRDDSGFRIARIAAYLRDNGLPGGSTSSNVASGVNGSYPIGVLTKAALSLSPNVKVVLASQGVVAGTQVLSGFLSEKLNLLNIGCTPYREAALNGCVGRVELFPHTMTEAELEELTA